MRRSGPLGVGAALLALFVLAGGPGAVARREDPETCKRNPNCVVVVTTRTTVTVLGATTVTLVATTTTTSTLTEPGTTTTVSA